MKHDRICLLSIIASHYRARVYEEMQREFHCGFVFGNEPDISVRRMDTSVLADCDVLRNRHIGCSNWYYQPGLLQRTRSYDVLINDLGIFCLSAWLLLIVARLRGQRVYHWDHGWYGREGLVKRLVKRLYFGMATGAFIYGDRAIELMGQNGFNTKKLYPIHNSLDYERQQSIRNNIQHSSIYKDHFGNDCPVLIMIGRLNLRKRLGMLIEAVNKLRSKGEIYNVVLVGDGEDRQRIEQMVRDFQLESFVWLYGACYDERQNAELIYNADMCVVPGDVGLTAIHAMMFGVPVVSHDNFPNQGPEYEAIKEGITGTFFKHGDVDSLSESISYWFSSKHDQREAVRSACETEIDQNWTPEYQINVLKKVICS